VILTVTPNVALDITYRVDQLIFGSEPSGAERPGTGGRQGHQRRQSPPRAGPHTMVLGWSAARPPARGRRGVGAFNVVAAEVGRVLEVLSYGPAAGACSRKS
jgi:hypothetical protein